MGEELRRIRTLPAWVAGAEMLADIARADGAQDGVGQRMQADIRIGVADQAMIVGDGDAAKHDPLARPKTVNVKAVTHPDIHTRGEQLPGAMQIGFRRHFEILLVTAHQGDGEASCLCHRRIIGQFTARRRVMRRHYIAIAEGLGCLGSPQGGAVERLLNTAIAAALHRIGDRQGRDGAGRGFKRFLLGSVSEAVAMNAHCSVVVVRSSARPARKK